MTIAPQLLPQKGPRTLASPPGALCLPGAYSPGGHEGVGERKGSDSDTHCGKCCRSHLNLWRTDPS